MTRQPFTTQGTIDDRLYVATRAWLIWIQGLYSNRPAGCYRWRPDPNTTELLVIDSEPDAEHLSQTRPIISKRGNAGYASMGIGQTMMPSYGDHNLRISDLVNSSLTLTVIAREGVEAQALAWQLFRLIPMFRAMIARLGRLHSIGPSIQISGEFSYRLPGAAATAPTWKAVSLSIPFSLQDTSDLSDDEIHSYVRSVEISIDDTIKYVTSEG